MIIAVTKEFSEALVKPEPINSIQFSLHYQCFEFKINRIYCFLILLIDSTFRHTPVFPKVNTSYDSLNNTLLAMIVSINTHIFMLFISNCICIAFLSILHFAF